MADFRRKGVETENKEQINRLKYEIAKELGLHKKIDAKGWGSLTAAETGRIGGMITTRRRAKGFNERRRDDVKE